MISSGTTSCNSCSIHVCTSLWFSISALSWSTYNRQNKTFAELHIISAGMLYNKFDQWFHYKAKLCVCKMIMQSGKWLNFCIITASVCFNIYHDLNGARDPFFLWLQDAELVVHDVVCLFLYDRFYRMIYIVYSGKRYLRSGQGC